MDGAQNWGTARLGYMWILSQNPTFFMLPPMGQKKEGNRSSHFHVYCPLQFPKPSSQLISTPQGGQSRRHRCHAHFADKEHEAWWSHGLCSELQDSASRVFSILRRPLWRKLDPSLGVIKESGRRGACSLSTDHGRGSRARAFSLGLVYSPLQPFRAQILDLRL